MVKIWLHWGTGAYPSVRAQGNLIEYAPMFMILMFIAESGGVSSFFVALLWRYIFVGPFDAWHLHGVHGEKCGSAFRRYNSYPAATFGHFRFAADAAVIR